MKEANIKRLERAADMLSKVSDLMETVIDKEDMMASDIYYLRKCVSQYAYDASTLRRIVKVAREDKE